MIEKITQEEIKELLSYDEKTGFFTWIAPTKGNRIKGARAGFQHSNGYRYIRLKGKDRYEHRLVFLYVTATYPKNEVDHINRNKNDNRFCNLREATRAENVRNVESRKDNSSGTSGVHWCNTHRKWIVQVQVNGKRIKGQFKSKEEAVEHRNTLVKEKHGVFGFIKT